MSPTKTVTKMRFDCKSNDNKSIAVAPNDIGLYHLPKQALHRNNLVNIVYFIGIFYHAKSGDKRSE